MDQSKNLFEVALAASDPLVSEIFQFDYGHIRFARKTFDQVRLSGADGSTQKIAFGKGSRVVFAPKCNVLAQPGLYGIESVNIVKCALGFEELNEAIRIVLDKLFLDLREVLNDQRFFAVLLGFDDTFYRAERSTGELFGSARDVLPHLRHR